MKLLTLALTLFAFALPAWAQEPSEASKAFFDQIYLLEEISPYVERVDMARVLVVKNSAQAVVNDMEKNLREGRKEVTFQTLRLVQNLIVQYRFSQVFFGWTVPRSITSIYTEATAAQLNSLKSLSEAIVSEYGYDDSPYTQITANTFRQMQRLLKQLEDLPLDKSLKAQLRALWPPIGETIAVAEQGDRPKAFEKAVVVIRLLRALYPLFGEISSSDAGFPMIMELQGLAEFYAEFAQMDASAGETK